VVPLKKLALIFFGVPFFLFEEDEHAPGAAVDVLFVSHPAFNIAWAWSLVTTL
jgi:hypothetical protein